MENRPLKKFNYQRQNKFFTQIAGSLEKDGLEELTELGAKNAEKAYRGIYFEADQKTLYTINYCSRLITRVLAPLSNFDCTNTDSLYTAAKKIPWDTFFSTKNTFAIFASVSNSKITHSKYASLRLKDAIADYFTGKCDRRPNVETKTPDAWINLRIDRDRAVISFDTSGGSLHRRGYRVASLEAPMQETLAAAIIRFSRWDGSKPFHDFMCGSGTLVCEALMHYCRIPAGYLRVHFGFERLPDFNKSVWLSVKNEMDSKMRPLPRGIINGSDLSGKAVSSTLANLKMLPHSKNISIKKSNMLESQGIPNAVLVSNPPYGIRMGEKEIVAALYPEIGNFLKRKCKGSEAYLYIGDRDLIKKIGLKPSLKKPMVNGALDGRLCKYEIYEGKGKKPT